MTHPAPPCPFVAPRPSSDQDASYIHPNETGLPTLTGATDRTLLMALITATQLPASTSTATVTAAQTATSPKALIDTTNSELSRPNILTRDTSLLLKGQEVLTQRAAEVAASSSSGSWADKRVGSTTAGVVVGICVAAGAVLALAALVVAARARRGGRKHASKKMPAGIMTGVAGGGGTPKAGVGASKGAVLTPKLGGTPKSGGTLRVGVGASPKGVGKVSVLPLSAVPSMDLEDGVVRGGPGSRGGSSSGGLVTHRGPPHKPSGLGG